MAKKTKILISVIVIAAALVGFVLYLFLTPSVLLPKELQGFTKLFEKKYTQADNTYLPTDKTIIYYPADFSENIYNDETFVELMDLYALEYIEGDSRYKIPVSDLEKYGGDLAVFFYEYFTTVRNGDHETYNSYFDKRAFSLREKASPFTMQQIYDISIEKLSIRPELDEKDYAWVADEGIEPIYVDVRYKIRRNNGTFRLGIESDTVKPQLYIMYQKGKTFKIINIVDYEPIYL